MKLNKGGIWEKSFLNEFMKKKLIYFLIDKNMLRVEGLPQIFCQENQIFGQTWLEFGCTCKLNVYTNYKFVVPKISAVV